MKLGHHARLLRTDDVPHALVVAEGETYQQYHEMFRIDDARTLLHRAYIKPAAEASQTCIVRFESITLEAQNALLKIVEEPPSATSIVFVAPREISLLRTLASRLEEYTETTMNHSAEECFQAFLSQPVSDRLADIERARKEKDLSWQRSMKRGLVWYLREHPADCSRELECVARWLGARGAANKMLLEQAALCLPTRPQGRK